MTTRSLLLRLLSSMTLITAVGMTGTGCAAEEEEEPEGSVESELKNAPDGQLQVYSMNTHHMSEPGEPSFEVTDFRQMIAYMRVQKFLPDIILLSEVGRQNSVPSQPCNKFVKRLEKVLSPKGKIQYACEVAKGSPDANNNAGGGTAIVYRKNLTPVSKKVLVQWTYHDGKCVPDPTGPGLTFVQTFKDGKRTVAAAALHLVSPTAPGDTNQYGRDCSEKNLREIADTLDRTGADAKVMGGDMNHADAKRRVEGANVIHEKWEGGYAGINHYLAEGSNDNGGFRDPWFDDAAATCGVNASGKTKYTAAQHQCISAGVAALTSVGRIDWLLAKGVSKIKDNVSIPFAEARAAFVAQTGNNAAVEKYSDHLAQRFTVVY